MSVHTLDFVINSSEKISIELKNSLPSLYTCGEASIVFWKDDVRYLLSFYSLYENMSMLKALLTKALENQLQLHPSIKDDIGYLFNQQLQHKPGLVYKKLDGYDYWVGNNYLLWSHELATWLYNESGTKSIILQITPIYPGNFITVADPSVTVPYKEWLKHYNSFFMTVLSRVIAQKWLDQVQNILDTMIDR